MAVKNVEFIVSEKGTAKTKAGLKGVDSQLVSMAKSAIGVGAAMMALRKASELTKLASDAINVEKAFRNLSKEPDKMLQAMKKAVGGTIAEFELMKQFNQAALLGLPLDRFDEMISIARGAAVATGQSMDFMLNSIVTGIGRQSKLMIDNLGILVSVEDANNKYAASLGTTADKLTDLQKKTAFANAVLDAGAKNLENMGGAAVGSFDGLNKLTSLITDFTIDAFKNLVKPIDDVAGGLADFVTLNDMATLSGEALVVKLAKNQEAFAGFNKNLRDKLQLGFDAEKQDRDAAALAAAAAKFRKETEDTAVTRIRDHADAVYSLIQLYPELGAVGASATDLQVSGLERLNLLTSTVKDSLGGMGQTWMQLAQMGGASNKTMFEIGKAASIASASINTYEAATKAYASAPPPFNFINAALVTAAGLAQVAMIKGTTMKAATGADFTTTGPQMMLVGEAGREHVSVTPLEGPNINGPKGGLTVNIYGNITDKEYVRGFLIPEFQRAVRLNA